MATVDIRRLPANAGAGNGTTDGTTDVGTEGIYFSVEEANIAINPLNKSKNYWKNKFQKWYNKYKRQCIDDLIEAKKEAKVRRGQMLYAFEYMIKNPTRLINQGELLKYCDDRRCEVTEGNKPNFKDNSRQIEKLRKDTFPHRWIELFRKDGTGLFFKYHKDLLRYIDEDVIKFSKSKKDNFSREVIQLKMRETNRICELTGLPVNYQCKVATDHWIPKEQCGSSTYENCVILIKLLNESKNNHYPTKWFCKSLLTNFLKVCQRSEMDMNKVKKELHLFIEEFE